MTHTVLIDPSLTLWQNLLPKMHFVPFGQETSTSSVVALVVSSQIKVNVTLQRSFPNIRVICSATSGSEHIDKRLFYTKSLICRSYPGCNANAVADYVAASIFYTNLQERLSNKPTEQKIIILGWGHVGARVYSRLLALGYQVFIYDPWKLQQTPKDLDDLLTTSDIIICHCSLTKTPQTHAGQGILNATRIHQLKKGAVLINAARGQIISTDGYEALLQRENEITFISDVWPNEPHLEASLVASAYIATPHIAGYSQIAKHQAMQGVANTLAEYFSLPLPKHPQTPLPQTVLLADWASRAADLFDFPQLKKDCLAASNDPAKFIALRTMYPLRQELAIQGE